MTEHNDIVESIEFSEEDIEDLELLNTEGVPSFHPILMVWQELLKPAAGELQARILPQWANKVVQSYAGVTFADMERYRDLYYTKILELAKILDIEIESDEKCLGYDSPEDDAVLNAHHYKNMLLQWQMQFLEWELEWDTSSPDAGVELAAISEVHKMFLGQNGIVNFLDQIPFEYTEADQAMLAGALDELKEGQ